MEDPEADYMDKVLFAGDSCYPQSPKVSKNGQSKEKISTDDQTVQILRVVGID